MDDRRETTNLEWVVESRHDHELVEVNTVQYSSLHQVGIPQTARVFALYLLQPIKFAACHSVSRHLLPIRTSLFSVVDEVITISRPYRHIKGRTRKPNRQRPIMLSLKQLQDAQSHRTIHEQAKKPTSRLRVSIQANTRTQKAPQIYLSHHRRLPTRPYGLAPTIYLPNLVKE